MLGDLDSIVVLMRPSILLSMRDLVIENYIMMTTVIMIIMTCSFHFAAPTVWNSLPHHIRQSDVTRGQFASRLKT